MNARRDTPS
ncbi:hypothetical protein D018_3708A, partial [Vibrio parahaemolyticus VP2007-007]